MLQPNKIPLAFAASGDKNIIPESTETTGLASWREGFPAITSTPFSEGGIAPKRADFNGIFNALSLAILWLQQGGFYAYDNATDYEVGNIVVYSGSIYVCLVANGPGSSVVAPTNTTTWSKISTAVDLEAYFPLVGGKVVTGTLIYDGASDVIQQHSDSGRIAICGGTQYGHGCSLRAYGSTHPVLPGGFSFETNDGNVTKELLGKPDGTLKWGGSNVWTERNVKTLATETLTKTLNPTDEDYSRVFSQNGVGYFRLCGKFSSATSGSATYDIYTSTIKPSVETYGFALTQGASASNMILTINTDGAIKLRTFGGTTPSSTFFWGGIVFPLA